MLQSLIDRHGEQVEHADEARALEEPHGVMPVDSRQPGQQLRECSSSVSDLQELLVSSSAGAHESGRQRGSSLPCPPSPSSSRALHSPIAAPRTPPTGASTTARPAPLDLSSKRAANSRQPLPQQPCFRLLCCRPAATSDTTPPSPLLCAPGTPSLTVLALRAHARPLHHLRPAASPYRNPHHHHHPSAANHPCPLKNKIC